MEEKRDTILARVETLLASNDYLIKEHPLNTVYMHGNLTLFILLQFVIS